MAVRKEDAIVAKTMKLAEEFFGTATDPRQIPITQQCLRRLRSLWKDAFLYELDGGSEPISWVVVVPTQAELARLFVNGTLTERQLFDQTEPAKRYDALYLCSMFTVPSRRRQGLATKLMVQAIQTAPVAPDAMLLAWPMTIQGEGVVRKIEQLTGRKVERRR